LILDKRKAWAILPSNWILVENGLRQFRHDNGLADNIMALMCLSVIAHEASIDNGYAKVTYDQFETTLNKSRSLVSRGLQLLLRMEIITLGEKRSEYQLANFNTEKSNELSEYRWAKFPCDALYDGKTIKFFSNLKLRGQAELDALKLLFLFAALRDTKHNIAIIGYEKIPERTGVLKDRIKKALSLLAVNGIVLVEMIKSKKYDHHVAHGYRLVGIDPYIHSGSTIRGSLLFS